MRAILLPGMYHRARRPCDMRGLFEEIGEDAVRKEPRFCQNVAVCALYGGAAGGVVHFLSGWGSAPGDAGFFSRGDGLGKLIFGWNLGWNCGGFKSRMKPARRQHFEKRAVELIEEAVHLLRQAPMATLAVYYIGSLPFVIGLLYFWAEMSRSPFAYEHLAGESLGLAALFLWMKVWQARFSRSLWAQVAGSFAGCVRLASVARCFDESIGAARSGASGSSFSTGADRAIRMGLCFLSVFDCYGRGRKGGPAQRV